MPPPKPTHPLAHLPDPPQNYIPCAPIKYWPSTMDEEQHSSQGNKWWWLASLSRATAVANVPSVSKIENTIEYFDTLTDLNCRLTGKPLPVPGTLCVLLNTLQRGSRMIAPAALAVFRMLGALHRRTRTTLLPALAAFRVLGLLRAFPEAGAKVEEYLVDPHRQIHLHASIHHHHNHSAILRCMRYPSTLTARPQDPPPPSSSPPAYSPPSRSLSPLVATRQRPCPDLAPSWEFSMSMRGKSQHNKPRLFACDNPLTPLRAHSPEPDHGVKTEPKPRTKTEPEPCVKQEVKLKLNLQHDVERLRSHSHVYLYNPDSESDDSMGVDVPVTLHRRENAHLFLNILPHILSTLTDKSIGVEFVEERVIVVHMNCPNTELAP
ncbi:hypothetical protein B0H13DRAFT_1861133 [Mycena leptocephala]|nr:hypothetical protein B0H13DRAFT_1861133 [Mycena leptocephala]